MNPASVMRNWRHRASHLAFDNIVYNWSLGGGSVPQTIAMVPPDAWPGHAEAGRALCNGSFVVEGEYFPVQGMLWESGNTAALAHVHGFSWLRDLRAAGGDEARACARTLISGWISHHARWCALPWRIDLTGRRMANWISFYEFYGASADSEFQGALFESLNRQGRHLARALPGGVCGVGLLHGIRGLALAGLAFSGRESWLEQALDLLQDESARQILPDGGHISRNPAQLLEALRVFVDIRAGLVAGAYPVPEKLAHTIDRMAQALRFFRMTDRHFCVFNGAQEGDETLIEAALLKSGAQGRVLRSLPQSGYERASLGRSLLILDAGMPPPRPYDAQSHAAPLAFEFSYGRERIFVSCGTHPLDEGWRDMLRATAAHTTLSIDSRNACEVREDGHIGRRPRHLTMKRDDSGEAVFFEGSHDGYLPLNGVIHSRRLYLGNQGHDLRGEEVLGCATGLAQPADIAVRFHLHPKVQASLVQDGRAVLLRLSGGAGWRFLHTGGALALEDSVYQGAGARPRKTKQIVIHGCMNSDEAHIKWALQREGV